MQASTGILTMRYQMAELLLRYPDPEQRLAAANALDTPNDFLAGAPDWATVAEWLQMFGENLTADELRASHQRKGHLPTCPPQSLPLSPPIEPFEMNALHTLAGVTHVLPFHLYDDVKRQPMRCELVVHPAQGWAVATELPDTGTAGLAQCQVTLATKICQEYAIDPSSLILFTRYAYSGNYENVYAVRFVSGERDLFDGIRFLGVRRDMLNPEDVTALVQQLTGGQAPAPVWHALPHAG